VRRNAAAGAWRASGAAPTIGGIHRLNYSPPTAVVFLFAAICAIGVAVMAAYLLK
jgi:hypothetical protein